MCGIAGIVYSDQTRVIGPAPVGRMCGVLRHRGPDETGTWIRGHAGLGMTRLSIIDIAGGRQPVHNEAKTVWVVFNGEIYNYRELRADLLKRGHRFYTSSDTETIVHLYEEYGENCVDHLRGMFAFAVWDAEKDQLLLARDRLGIKPLHYYVDDERIVFGSEIKSILQCDSIPRQVLPRSLVNYFFYGYVPDPETIFQGIYKLPPGHVLVYRNGRARVHRYWDIAYTVGKVETEEFYIERLLDLLDEAVRIRLMSEVPLGAFLSGGTDSSMVVALMARHMGEPVKTFSIGFENQKYNELVYARMVAERYGTDHHEQIVQPDAEAIIIDLVRQFDEPFADSSAIPTYYVSRFARQSVTVALTGDGGDEVFGGYTHHLKSPLARYANWIPPRIRKSLFLNTSSVLPEWFPGINTLRHFAGDDTERYVRQMTRGLSTIHDAIFSRELGERVATTDPSPAVLQYLNGVNGMDDLTKRLYLDTKTYLPGDILTKVDRTSMMVSLEARVPILDHHLVEFAATIPPEFKVNGRTTKYLFKKAAERLLPKEVIYRPKQGFAVPIAAWIRKDWSDMSHELVLGQRALSRKNFNPVFLRRIMSEHRLKRRDHSHIIWTLMILELWYREIMDRQPSTINTYISS